VLGALKVGPPMPPAPPPGAAAVRVRRSELTSLAAAPPGAQRRGLAHAPPLDGQEALGGAPLERSYTAQLLYP
jgi:hypothetical protein